MAETKQKQFKYVLLLLGVTAIWGLAFVGVKFCTNHNMPVFLLLYIRFFIGALLIFIIKLIKKQPKITKQEFWIGILLGAVAFAAYAAQTYGAVYTTAGKGGMLTGVYVIFIPLFLCIIKKRFVLKPFIDSAICVVGMVLFFGVFNQSLSFNLGDGLTLICAFVFACQFILLEKYAVKLNVWNFSMMQLLTVGVLSLITSLSMEIPQYSLIDSINVIYVLLYLGLLSTGFAFYGQTLAQAHLSATTAGVISCMESLFAVVFSLILGYDQFRWYIAVGGAIMLLSMLSSTIIKGKHNYLSNPQQAE